MPLPKKTSLSIATFGALFLLLQFAKLAPPFSPDAVLDFHPRPAPAPPEPPARRLAAHITIKELPAQPNLIDHDNLKALYQALWRTEAKQPGAVTRILHYGDSPVTADSITADMRSLMQERFGDSGHGFILIAKPWAWYGHRGIDVSGKGWKIEAASQSRAPDGIHGLGGVSFIGATGASSHFVLKEDHSWVELQFLRQPDGGTVSVRAAGQTVRSVETAGIAKDPGFETVGLPAGAREIDVVVDRGPVRLFGVSFERDTPGVIYNSLGLNGAQVQAILRSFEKNQWARQLQHQKPDLVVINYGTNESIYADYVDRSYAGELREVIQRVKSAVPNASVLVMSPMDHAEKSRTTGEMATPPALARLVNIQKRTAADMDCAFFNTFQAMGGEGTMVRWYHSQPPLVSADYMHPFPGGARKVGVLLYQALEDGFEQFKLKQRMASDRARNGEPQP
jgi:lysophospholipase L1-like esterase